MLTIGDIRINKTQSPTQFKSITNSSLSQSCACQWDLDRTDELVREVIQEVHL